MNQESEVETMYVRKVSDEEWLVEDSEDGEVFPVCSCSCEEDAHFAIVSIRQIEAQARLAARMRMH